MKFYQNIFNQHIFSTFKQNKYKNSNLSEMFGLIFHLKRQTKNMNWPDQCCVFCLSNIFVYRTTNDVNVWHTLNVHRMSSTHNNAPLVSTSIGFCLFSIFVCRATNDGTVRHILYVLSPKQHGVDENKSNHQRIHRSRLDVSHCICKRAPAKFVKWHCQCFSIHCLIHFVAKMTGNVQRQNKMPATRGRPPTRARKNPIQCDNITNLGSSTDDLSLEEERRNAKRPKKDQTKSQSRAKGATGIF